MLKLGTRATALENAVAHVRRRQTEPAYVRCTMYDLQSLRALRGGGGANAKRNFGTVRGRSYKGAGALGGAYVRFINNVRIVQIFFDSTYAEIPLEASS